MNLFCKYTINIYLICRYFIMFYEQFKAYKVGNLFYIVLWYRDLI